VINKEYIWAREQLPFPLGVKKTSNLGKTYYEKFNII
jgi:hypothetical protein